MKTIISLCILWISIAPMHCQSVSKGDEKKFAEAVEKRKSGEADKAIKILNKLLEKYPEDIDILTEKGVLYVQEENDSLAIESFQKAWDVDPNASYRLTYTLANLYKKTDQYKEALSKLEHLKTFDKIRPGQLALADKLRSEVYFTEYAKANPKEIELERLSANINTDASEYLPAFSADGQTLIYTTRAGRQEDFYISSFDGESFTTGIPMDGLNTSQNEGAHCLSPDGEYLFFTGCHMEGSQGGCDLYITTKQDGEWIKPVNMGPNVNSREWDAQPSLSPDGKRLYFTSERKGGLGKSDIWYVDFKDGSWGKPINAGDVINTAGNEASPYIHLDGQTLYFRSDGHVGMGDYDLFLSRWDKNEWGEVENLGYPINSAGSEGALSVSTDGQYAYYASDIENDNLDIFRFKLPEELKPQKVTYFKAQILDAETQEPMKAVVEVYDVIAQETYMSDITNQQGYLLASVPERSQYSIHVSAPDYIFYSDNISWTDTTSVNKPQEITILLQKIKAPEVIASNKKETAPVILKNIFFESGSDKLLSSSDFEIIKLSNILQESPEAKIRITGYTDNVGSEEDNQILSLNRATSVKNALIEKGIDASRIMVQGLGETNPIDTNDTEEGRKNNRRTEFALIRA